jgi:hypothetical protein
MRRNTAPGSAIQAKNNQFVRKTSAVEDNCLARRENCNEVEEGGIALFLLGCQVVLGVKAARADPRGLRQTLDASLLQGAPRRKLQLITILSCSRPNSFF